MSAEVINNFQYCPKIAFLNSEFHARKEKNANYSIGAFARSIEADSSSLGRFLSGKRKLTDKKFIEFASKLSLTPIEIKNIINKGNEDIRPNDYYETFDENDFEKICEWHHFAIIKLLSVKNFKSDPAWIAKRLNLKIYEVKEALEVLESLNLILIKDGRYIDNTGFMNFSKINSSSIKKHQRGLLKEAYASITKLDAKERAHSTLTVAMSKKKLEVIRRRMIEFKTEINQLIAEDEDKDEVFNLCLSLFPSKRISE